MLIKSILNRIQPQKGFVYGNVRWREHRGRLALDIEISPRRGVSVQLGTPTVPGQDMVRPA
jgi:hypothetical protein